MIELAGGCVCGGVRYSTDGVPMRITACHCTWCRRRTGTAFGTECVFPTERVHVRGDALRSYRHHSDLSGRWLEQDFCSICGSNIGLRLEAVPALRSLSIGSFDDLSLTDKAADDRRAISNPLVAFNRAKAPDGHHRPLNVLLRDEDGNVTGGLWGRTDWGWLEIELLCVPETFRGQGTGAETVKAAEREARTHGCHGAWVNTFGWQARGFYQSLDYALFGELPDYPTGYARLFLQKKL